MLIAKRVRSHPLTEWLGASVAVPENSVLSSKERSASCALLDDSKLERGRDNASRPSEEDL